MTPHPAAPPTAPPPAQLGFGLASPLAFCLLATLTCTASVFVTGLNPLDISDPGGQRCAATPPPVTPTPRRQSLKQAADGDAPALGAYSPGEQVRNITPSLVNIRATPGYLGKPAGDVVAQAMPGDAVEIVDGPVVADNLTWWRATTRPRRRRAEG